MSSATNAGSSQRLATLFRNHDQKAELKSSMNLDCMAEALNDEIICLKDAESGLLTAFNKLPALFWSRPKIRQGFPTPVKLVRNDLQPALGCLGDLVYAPLAKHLADASHLIIYPDGQMSRSPFEELM